MQRKKTVDFPGGVKPDLLAKLTPERIRALASDGSATYLEALEDWREAVPFILRELGINISAWLDAVEVMGEAIAFLALIVIDRNRFHPVVPVRSHGGALRAFTRKAERAVSLISPAPSSASGSANARASSRNLLPARVASSSKREA